MMMLVAMIIMRTDPSITHGEKRRMLVHSHVHILFPNVLGDELQGILS